MSWSNRFDRVQVARDATEAEDVSLLMELGEVGKGFSRLFGSGPSTEKKNDNAPDGGAAGSFFGGLSSAFRSEETRPEQPVLGMSYTQRFRAFMTLVMLAVLFFAIAFTVGLPIIVVRPAKFAISFTSGSLFFMLAFMVLKGPMTHIKSMFTPEKAPFAALYLSSMLGTLWASLVARSYFLVMIASGAQICALLYYLVAGIPGGSQGVSIFLKGLGRMARAALYPCWLGAKACFANAFRD